MAILPQIRRKKSGILSRLPWRPYGKVKRVAKGNFKEVEDERKAFRVSAEAASLRGFEQHCKRRRFLERRKPCISRKVTASPWGRSVELRSKTSPLWGPVFPIFLQNSFGWSPEE
jgi:hypothetical protein